MSPTAKPVGPCQWIMEALKYVSGDLELHGHSDHFSLGVHRSGLRTSSTANRKLYKALDDFMVHDINNP